MTLHPMRRYFLLAAVICACLAVMAAPAPGDPTPAPIAPTGASPVTINSCGPIINDKNATTNVLGVPLPVSQSSGIQIEFVNEATQPATLVNFSVDSSGDNFIIRDVGKFTPGVSIKHQYRNGSGQAFVLPAFIAPNIKCHVVSAQFADGSVWRQGETTAQLQPAPPGSGSSSNLQASPASLTVDMASDFELFLVQSTDHVTAFKEIDNCAKVAAVSLAISGDSTATYKVKPIALGSCTAHVIDENGTTLSVPITVK